MLGRYQLVVRLARGSTTEVWLTKGAGDKGLAVKALRLDIPQTPELLRAFAREVTVTAKLHHPNIVELYDCGRIGSRHYMAMEHVDGMSLAQVGERLRPTAGRLPLALLARLMHQICVGLQYAHELSDDNGWLGFLHRDVSPENILVSAHGTAKLIDFGNARMRSVPDAVGPQALRTRYAAPERVQGLSEDRRSDVYSVGVILYEFATGTPPFAGTDLELMSQIVEGHPRDPRELVPDLPEALAQVILRAMAPKFADRYPTAQALGNELEAFAAAHAVATDGAELDTVMRSLGDSPAERRSTPPSGPHPVVRQEAAPQPPPAPETSERFAPDADFSTDDITRPTVVLPPEDTAAIPLTRPEPEPEPEPEPAPAAAAAPPAPPSPPPAWLNERQQALSQAPADIFGGARRPDGGGRSFPFTPGPGPAAGHGQGNGQSASADSFVERRSAPRGPDVFSLYTRRSGDGRPAPEMLPPAPPPAPAPVRRPVNPAAQRFDRGLELLAAKLHEPALAEWEEACRLDPDNRLYQTNLKRLRAQLAARAPGQTTETE